MRRLINSFGYAISGVAHFFLQEKNGQIELFAGIIAILMGLFLHISTVEWCIVWMCIGSVLSLEMLNSALEKLIDHLHPQQHPHIKVVKDIAAGAVLLFSFVTFIIGLLIFLPKIIVLFNR